MFSKKQTITVTSDVDGAMVYKGKKYIGNTPLTYRTKVAKSTFTVAKEGYPTQTINADVDIRWNTLWNWFNSGIGWLVDVAVGSTQKYTKTNYFVSLKDPSINAKYNEIHKRQNNTISAEQAIGILAAATSAGISAAQQRKAEQNLEKARQAEINLEKARQESQKQAKLQNSKKNEEDVAQYIFQDTQQTKTTTGYSDLLTSDPEWNKSIHFSVQQYGVEKTREIVNQRRANDYQQSVQSNSNYSSPQSNDGQVISAVTSSRTQVYIRVNSMRNITAYSMGVDPFGKRKWNNLLPYVPSRECRLENITGNMGREFKYTAIINNIRIFFNL